MSSLPPQDSAADPASTRLINRAIVALAVAAFGSGMSMRVADPMLVRLA